ncbi:MAG: DUF4876 domain-containing protein [Prevotella sp.]|nr:DUF4876 domain-containing protein [Prevotella sp.]
MKKTILLMAATALISLGAQAQNYKMVITKADGTQVEFSTTEIDNITYVEAAEPILPDQNADQVVIKEIYNGGCPSDDGKTFQYDKCIILYNNCGQQAVVNNLCIGAVQPANGHSKNENYDESGKLVYEAEGIIPCWHGIWWFQGSLVIEPYSQIVVNICGAIDNTQTVSQSVNYANPAYYAMYDPESGYANTKYYPTPSAEIPTSNYLKAKEIGMGNGWTYSVSSPATVIFQTQGMDAQAFADDADRLWYPGGEVSQVNACFAVPATWVIDGVEIFSSANKDNSVKRLTADIDGGYVYLTNYLGHSLYRNVDKAATEALSENAGKLVYNYALGVDDSTDPSGIDAEASMKNGAHIIFQDNNNSSEDFHERQKCSLRGE